MPNKTTNCGCFDTLPLTTLKVHGPVRSTWLCRSTDLYGNPILLFSMSSSSSNIQQTSQTSSNTPGSESVVLPGDADLMYLAEGAANVVYKVVLKNRVHGSGTATTRDYFKGRWSISRPFLYPLRTGSSFGIRYQSGHSMINPAVVAMVPCAGRMGTISRIWNHQVLLYWASPLLPDFCHVFDMIRGYWNVHHGDVPLFIRSIMHY